MSRNINPVNELVVGDLMYILQQPSVSSDFHQMYRISGHVNFYADYMCNIYRKSIECIRIAVNFGLVIRKYFTDWPLSLCF